MRTPLGTYTLGRPTAVGMQSVDQASYVDDARPDGSRHIDHDIPPLLPEKWSKWLASKLKNSETRIWWRVS